METKECILKRRSIREFTDEAVSDEQIKDLLECAMAAPSARNTQPWEFYVIKDAKVQQKVREFQPRFNYNSNVMFLICANRNAQQPFTENGFWNQDCSAAIENLLLEACNIGLGTCWCGVYPRVDSVEFFRNLLKINEDVLPFALIHVGYPKADKDPLTYYNEDKIHII